MKVAVIAAHTGSLLWFRSDMMKDFVAAGHDVLAVGNGPASQATESLIEAGIQYQQVEVQRNGLNPLDDLKYLAKLVVLLSRERPDKVFLYQAKPVVYGAIAARAAGVGDVYSLVAGLGSVLRGDARKNRLLRSVMAAQYWLSGKCCRRVFFQNEDDRREFIHRRLVKEQKTAIINGSGVNLGRFESAPLPTSPALLFIGRLIKDKGIQEYLAACERIGASRPATERLLVGPYDSNPSAMSERELRPYIDAGVVQYFGEQDDVLPFLHRCSVFVLPSYHEGTPKTVLEAMAVGRPVVTTDAPGCRDTVEHGINGYLVPPGDVDALTAAITRIIDSPEEAECMARAGRRIAEAKYDVHLVNQTIMRYMGLLEASNEEG